MIARMLRRFRHAFTGHHAGDCVTGDLVRGHLLCCCGKRITEHVWVDPHHKRPPNARAIELRIDGHAVGRAVNDAMKRDGRRG